MKIWEVKLYVATQDNGTAEEVEEELDDCLNGPAPTIYMPFHYGIVDDPQQVILPDGMLDDDENGDWNEQAERELEHRLELATE